MTDLLKDFNFLGITLRDWPDEMVGKFSGKRLIICAGAACVWDDLALLGIRKEESNTHFMAINDVVMHLPMKVRHFYSNDHRMMPFWLGARRPQYARKHGPVDYTHSARSGGQHTWPWPGHGTSTLGGVYTALAMGYAPVILCGCPLDDSPNYFSPSWEKRNFSREVADRVDGKLAYWSNAHRCCFKGRVFSMSGRTRELLGAP